MTVDSRQNTLDRSWHHIIYIVNEESTYIRDATICGWLKRVGIGPNHIGITSNITKVWDYNSSMS